MKSNKLNLTAGILLALVAVTFAAMAGLLIYSFHGFLKSGVAPFWYASIPTLIVGWLFTFLAQTIIVIFIAGSFIVFGIYLAMCILTFLFGANANGKAVKCLQICVFALNAVVIINLIDIIKAFALSINAINRSLSAVDIAIIVLIAISAVIAAACEVLCIVNLAAAKKSAAETNINYKSNGENL